MRRINKVLVANRGTVALRVLSTLRKLGIPGVGLYHNQDRLSPAIQEADECVEIHGASPLAAYLDIGNLVQACLKSGADAVHPGYGLLAENPALPQALDKHGLCFIGPDADTMARMGDKIRAREFAASQGIGVAPGVIQDGPDAEFAKQIEALGFPILLKARAGGGGKAMLQVDDSSTLLASIEQAHSEAARYFGDAMLLAERYFPAARHVEVQVLGDGERLIHLGERDCSLQRRRQKIIEETPAPNLDAGLRTRILYTAVQLATAIRYRGLGTVEFLLTAQGEVFFLEMNTRLQVEHRVTEAVTGLDLVAEQVRIADGQPLNLTQNDVCCRGHAVECRIYAEKPEAEFAPCTGTIHLLKPPESARFMDLGVCQGQTVGTHFDPMLGVLVSHADTREQALQGMDHALAATVILGLEHNINWLRKALVSPRLCSGSYHTDTVSEEDDWREQNWGANRQCMAAVAACAFQTLHETRFCVPEPYAGMMSAHDIDAASGVHALRIDGEEIGVALTPLPDAALVWTDGTPHRVCWRNEESRGSRLWVDSERVDYHAFASADTLWLHLGGTTHKITLIDRLQRQSQSGREADATTRAPMPGVVIDVCVAPGDAVQCGAALLVIESMKLQTTIRATRDGSVARVHVTAGEDFARNAALITLAKCL